MKNLMLAGALCVGLSACNARDYATPEQAEDLTELEVGIDDHQEKIEVIDSALEDKLKEQAALYAAALSAGVADVEALKAQLEEQQTQIQGMLEAQEALKAERDALVDKHADLEGEITGPAQDALFSVLGQTVPASWGGPLAIAGYLGSRLLSRRGRRHFKNSVKNAIDLEPKRLIASIGAYLGHGSGTRDDALESAVAQAIKEGDAALAKALGSALAARKMAAESLQDGVQGIPSAPPQTVPGVQGAPVPPPQMTPGPQSAGPVATAPPPSDIADD